MLAQSAYRSVDTMTKDLTDQNVVTKADAEHMYARFDLELDTPLTAHGTVPMSIRSSHHSRRMSRRTPQHGHRTSQSARLKGLLLKACSGPRCANCRLAAQTRVRVLVDGRRW